MRRWIGTNRSLEERCTTEYIYGHNFYRSSRDLAFPDKILRGVRGVKWQLKNLGIFLGKLSLDLGISFCCLSVLSFEEVYFRHRNMFIYTSITTGCTYKNKLKSPKWVISVRSLKANFICRNHYAMTISKLYYRLYERREVNRYFITYLVSVLTKSIIIKLRRKSVNLSPKSFFWTSKQPFALYFFLATCNICPVAIPEIFGTQGSDYWQLIHWPWEIIRLM